MLTEVSLPATGIHAHPSTSAIRRLLSPIFLLLAACFTAYVAWLVLQRTFHYSRLWNGWIPDGFEFVVALLCMARGLVRERGRAVGVILGLGLLSWCFGDTVWTAQSVVGSSPATTYLVAAFWIGFYPFAYLAVILFIRRRVQVLTLSSGLDGAIAALGTASLCAAFAFHGLSSYDTTGVFTRTTNLAYPIGDLLLLALVVGGTAMLRGKSTTPWVVLGAACVLNCIGDTFKLFQSTEGALRVDTVFHALAWPAAGLLMTVAVWLRPRSTAIRAEERPIGFALPGIAATASLVVLATGTMIHEEPAAVWLAIGSLFAAGIRFMLSAHGLQSITHERHRQSMTDELTGLGNRRCLFDISASFFGEFSEPDTSTRRLTFLFMDLNRFKEINDSFGHLAGDELLRQLGPRLSQSLGSSDMLVRVGGDEFGIVTTDADDEHATDLAHAITRNLEDPFDLHGVSARIGASIGIASIPDDASDISGLLECADLAMYQAKSAGLPFALYNSLLGNESQWRLGEDLASALARQEFVLYYQPKLHIRTGELDGVEALVRWQHPKQGLLLPSRFLALVEDAGLMALFTEMVMGDALRQCAKWHQTGHHLNVSVNISPANLLDDGFTELVQRHLAEYGLPASSLVLEITETSVIANLEQSKAVIEELRALGVVVSIDDFGAGFTSLAYLSRLPVRELKLDAKLVGNLASEERRRDRDLVRATIELGHALGMRVVAEGVEDRETLELLHDLGCDVAQGYFISRPVTADKVDLRLRLPAGLVAAL